MDSKDLQNELIKTINTIISNEKLNKLPFDRTYLTRIINKTQTSSTSYKYTVIIEKDRYNITSTENYSIGNKVRVRIPRNNWNEIYIESKA